MLFREKVPYFPSEAHRFKISSDPLSRERMRLAHAAVREIRADHPFVVGAVMFGSITKEKHLVPGVAQMTDMDMVVYVDPDLIKVGENGLTDDNKDWKASWKLHDDIEPIGNIVHNQREEYSAFHYLEGLFYEKIGRKLSIDNEIYGPIGVHIKKLRLSGENSLLDIFDAMHTGIDLKKVLSSKRLKDIVHYSTIAFPWALDISGGMRKYREAYLKSDLGAMSPEERELRWKITVDAIQYFERNNNIPDALKRYYPQTYDEAVRFYTR